MQSPPNHSGLARQLHGAMPPWVTPSWWAYCSASVCIRGQLGRRSGSLLIHVAEQHGSPDNDGVAHETGFVPLAHAASRIVVPQRLRRVHQVFLGVHVAPRRTAEHVNCGRMFVQQKNKRAMRHRRKKYAVSEKATLCLCLQLRNDSGWKEPTNSSVPPHTPHALEGHVCSFALRSQTSWQRPSRGNKKEIKLPKSGWRHSRTSLNVQVEVW